jgi:antitoxin VapB
MPEQRHVRLFRSRNQAVRIPVEFELPGDEAIMHRDGDRLVIAPVRKRGLVALLKTMKPLEEGFPEIDDPVPVARIRISDPLPKELQPVTLKDAGTYITRLPKAEHKAPDKRRWKS